MKERKQNFKVFEDLELGMIRCTEDKTGEIWFVLADVCRVLGMSENSMVTRVAGRLTESEKGMHTVHTPSGDQEMTVVNESGLYHVINTSRMPNAEKFRLWVTGTVLVSIREHKGYILGQEDLSKDEQEALHKSVEELSPEKGRSPMEFEKAYIAKDGTVFTDWKQCVEYNSNLWT